MYFQALLATTHDRIQPQIVLNVAVFGQLQHQIDEVAVLEEAVQLQNGGMVEAPMDGGLLLDALGHAVHLHQVLVDHLDGAVAAADLAARPVDAGEGALAEQIEAIVLGDAVAARLVHRDGRWVLVWGGWGCSRAASFRF